MKNISNEMFYRDFDAIKKAKKRHVLSGVLAGVMTRLWRKVFQVLCFSKRCFSTGFIRYYCLCIYTFVQKIKVSATIPFSQVL